jgi:prepilin-type processing-associated H-X9-DG protein/prepilin-type N-terminal cleavage/methylation domain-containing protein
MTPLLHPKHARRIGFTLIELLTVIAVIGVLAGLLIPVVGKVRATARNAQCVSNLRQIGTALNLYAQDNKGNYPPSCDRVMDFLAEYFNAVVNNRNTDITRQIACPSATWPGFIPSNNTASVRALGYAGSPAIFPPVNTASTVTVAPLMASTIRRPSQVIVIADSGQQAGPGASPRFVSSIYDEFRNPSRANPANADNVLPPTHLSTPAWDSGESLFAARHGNKGNCLFADGHVSALAPTEIRERNIYRGY